MDLKRIEHLLQRFYNGKSTTEEEKELKDFFISNDVPRHLWAEQEMFTYYNVEHKEKSSEGNLKSKIISTLHKEEQAETERSIKKRRIYYIVSSAAASIILIIAAYFTFISGSGKDTYDNPEVAYMQAKETLLFVSDKLNRGTKELQTLEKFTEATEQLKNVSKMEYSTKSVYTLSLFGTGLKNLENLSKINDPFQENE